MLYGNKIELSIKESFSKDNSHVFSYRVLMKEDLSELFHFIEKQPPQSYEYFKPHDFNIKTLSSLYNNKSFLMMGVFDSKKMIGYFFIRFFVNKNAFRGKIVDAQYQGRGIAKQMGHIMTNISFLAGFRLFATVSKNNITSIASSNAVNKIKIIKELPNDYIYVEYFPNQEIIDYVN